MIVAPRASKVIEIAASLLGSVGPGSYDDYADTAPAAGALEATAPALKPEIYFRPKLKFWRATDVQIKAIFFDIDGTLVDSNDMHVLAWEEAFVNAGQTSGQRGGVKAGQC